MRDSLPGLLDSESSLNPSLPIKLLFDENIGAPIGLHIAGVLSFHKSPPVIDFVVRKFGPGAKDHDWIPLIADEGWIVLSTDRSKRCGGAKLERVCAAYRVTHILMSTSLHERKQFEKAVVILRMWDDIANLASAPRGSGHRLMMRNRKFVVAPSVRKLKKNKVTFPPDEVAL
jgi:hypothetical protein